jgi:hypothetical protein
MANKNRIRVKALPDRIVKTAPNGDFIPSDRFVTVEFTNYVDRLINVHGDLIVEEEKPAEAVSKKDQK